MKSLEKGQDKIQKICDSLRKETLEPAKKEADRIIQEAEEHAKEIISEAKKEANALHELTRVELEKERNVFVSSLSQSAEQCMEALRQSIEDKLFSENLDILLSGELSQPDVIAKVVSAVIEAVKKEGIAADLNVILPQKVPAKEVSERLGANIMKMLEKGPISVGDFTGGAKIQLLDKKMTIDISEQAIKEIIASYVRKDFRDLIFKTKV